MLKSISLSLAIMSLSVAAVQAQRLKPVGIVGSGTDLELVMTPSATLVVSVEVEHESVEVGEYARYAQKFLGLRAPLVARESSKILSAKVAKAPENFEIATEAMMTSESAEVISQVATPLPMVVTSAEQLSLEEAAEAAAEEIFSIRLLRRDILSGDLGEGLYGGGLAAALEFYDKKESELVEMFMGRTIRSRESSTFYVTLDGQTKRYVVSRFSESAGMVALSDLSGDPILLQLTPAKSDKLEQAAYDSKSTTVTFRVPEKVKCDLYLGTQILDTKTISLDEFGYDYTHVISVK